MQPAPFVSIIIITWNSKKYLPACLDHLLAQFFQDFEVILVDNGSRDGALDGLQVRYPSLDLHVHELSANLGFAAANNLGVRHARGKWLVLLNADAFAEPDWLEKLIHSSEHNPEFSFFASRLIQANAPHLLDGGGDNYHVSGLAWKGYSGYPAARYGLTLKEVFSPCAAAAMYSRQAFLEVGGFDEDFFSYFEDVDLGFRLRLRGHRCLYVPDAVAHHIGSATFGLRSDFAYYHTQRNLVWMFLKNMPPAMLWKHLPAHLLANLIYLIYYSWKSQGKSIWRSKWDAVRGLKRTLQKRREIQSRRVAAAVDLERVMEHGFLTPYTRDARVNQAIKNQ